ncbi:MAG TPA: EamA family transporter [Anaerolineae bacterium]|nr:EamA family transporter [Anaerolineae bacterium]
MGESEQRSGSTSKSTWHGYPLVVGAALLWGTLGILFKHIIGTYGLSPLTLAFFRAALAFLGLLAGLGLFHRSLLRLDRRNIPFFALFGLVSVAGLYLCYAYAVHLTTVATAVVLLYTAPAFVTLIAWRAWGEPLTRRKGVSLLLTFVGCVLVARAYDPDQLRLNLPGLIFGLGSGLTYALYTVFGRQALRMHSPWTAVTYALGFGAAFLLPFQSPQALRFALQTPSLWWLLAAVALGPTVGAYILYTTGLRHVQASAASIVATLEPVTAVALSFLLLGERFAPPQALGGLMIIAGVVLLSSERS